jgi:outer membrane protein OmpA-like peptidoglycan-associated protein
MMIDLAAAARIVPLTAPILGACVSRSTYDKQTAELQQARAQAAAGQSQIQGCSRSRNGVVAGDLLFPEDSYQLSANGKRALNSTPPSCKPCRNAKVVVYG